MIPAAFDYQKVKTVDEAIAALAGGDGKLLAGGHSLIPAMKLRMNRPVKTGGYNRVIGTKRDKGRRR